MWTPNTRRQHSRAELRDGNDLIDGEWDILHPFVPPEARSGCKPVYPMREIVNAICYMPRGGIAWRLMPELSALAHDRPLGARLRDDGT